MRQVDRDLIDAAKHGDLAGVKKAIDKGANPNLRYSKLLHNYDSTSILQITPLIEASRMGHTKIVRLLLDHGADPNLQNEDGKTALDFVQGYPHSRRPDIIEMLEESKEDLIHVVKNIGAMATQKDWNKINSLIHAFPTDLDEALYYASESGNIAVAQLLLSAGADPNYIHKREGFEGTWNFITSTLSIAIKKRYTEMVRLLLDHGANVHYTSVYSHDMIPILTQASIEWPGRLNNLDIVKLILKHGNFSKREILGALKFHQYYTTSPDIAVLLAEYGDLSSVDVNYKTLSPKIVPALKLFFEEKRGYLTKRPAEPSWVTSKEKYQRYQFEQSLKSLNVSQLLRVYQKVYGKKCSAKTKREILKLLHRK
jgi:ankyrin repeat protein